MKTGCLLAFVTLITGSPLIARSQDASTQPVDQPATAAGLAETQTVASPWWMADGRTAFEHDAFGISRVQYFSPAVAWNNPVLFYQRLWEGFRLLVQVDGAYYTANMARARITPWSVVALVETPSGVFQYQALAINDAIVLTMQAPKPLKGEAAVRFSFHDHFTTLCEDSTDFRMSSGEVRRTAVPFLYDEAHRRLLGGMQERGRHNQQVGVSITFDEGCSYRRVEQNVKHLVEAKVSPDRPFRCAVRMHARTIPSDQPPVADAEKLYGFLRTKAEEDQAFLAGLDSKVQGQESRYAKLAEVLPVLKGVEAHLSRFFSIAPLYHESCRVPAIPGALRASNVHYWVWGWDGMTDNASPAAWGQAESLRNLLDFYRTNSDAQGFAHAYGYDMSIVSHGPLPAQLLYPCLLQRYYDSTGDLQTVRRHFDYVRQMYRRIQETSTANELGLLKGGSLFPDFGVFMHETGNDYSAMNNTILYCGLRAIERLAVLMDDNALANSAGERFQSIERNFLKYFLDPQQGFTASSMDATTLQRRNSFMLSGLKWESDALLDLLEPELPRLLAFVEKNLMGQAGLRETPLWGDVFDADGNQLHCWWPVISDFFVHAANQCARPDLLTRFSAYLKPWVQRLTCPEGISVLVETNEPEMDRWNTLKGAWQAYSVRGWYQSVLNGVLGVRSDIGGLTIQPGQPGEWSVEGLHHLGRRFDVVKSGKGLSVVRLIIDGRTVEGTCKTPHDILRAAMESGGPGRPVRVEVVCADREPQEIGLKDAFGALIENFSRRDGQLIFRLSGAGTTRVRLRCAILPKVRVDGREVQVQYLPLLKTATFTVRLVPGQSVAVQAAASP